MDLVDFLRQIEKVEKVWPDERPWTISSLSSMLQMPGPDLVTLFQNVVPVLESEKDQVLPEDLRLLKAYCETQIESRAKYTHAVDLHNARTRVRNVIGSILPKISLLTAKKEYEKALKSYQYLLGEALEHALPEEKAMWYEDMGRLALKLDHPRQETVRYFHAAIDALAISEDPASIEDLLSTYKADFLGKQTRGKKFQGNAVELWNGLVEHGESLLSTSKSDAQYKDHFFSAEEAG